MIVRSGQGSAFLTRNQRPVKVTLSETCVAGPVVKAETQWVPSRFSSTQCRWFWHRYYKRYPLLYVSNQLRRKFSRRSSRYSNPRPFNHESGALTTELSPPPIRWKGDTAIYRPFLLPWQSELRPLIPWWDDKHCTLFSSSYLLLLLLLLLLNVHEGEKA